jgi:hypothetical protein
MTCLFGQFRVQAKYSLEQLGITTKMLTKYDSHIRRTDVEKTQRRFESDENTPLEQSKVRVKLGTGFPQN